MVKFSKLAFVFPGQGAQYVGMGKEFYQTFPAVREMYQAADEILGRNLSGVILEGPNDLLVQTRNSQAGIFVMSASLLMVVKENFPSLKPAFCAGLSLGEYTALFASDHVFFEECLHVVERRGQFMNEACERTLGTMAVVIGLTAEEVDDIVKAVNMPNDLWVANYNCPGQVVISGTVKGVEAGSDAAVERGAKRVLPLKVHGAFHSGLMKSAEESLAPYVYDVQMNEGSSELVMNVPGDIVKDSLKIKSNLIKQITSSVRWEQSVRCMFSQGVDLIVEIGCGKTLTGFNKRINPAITALSIETPKDLEQLAQYM